MPTSAIAPTPGTVGSAGEGRTHLGERLRNLRISRGLTLHDVEARSAGEFRPSALGAYERGERALSVRRLVRLAEVYGVDPGSLIASAREIDLPALHREESSGPEESERDQQFVLGALARFASYVRAMRREPSLTPLTVRQSDLEQLEVTVGRDRHSLEQLLAQLGIRAPARA